jgi:hypothetical protein
MFIYYGAQKAINQEAMTWPLIAGCWGSLRRYHGCSYEHQKRADEAWVCSRVQAGN